MIMAVLLLSATLAHAQGAELLVYQVQAAQLPGTALVDVWYKLQTVGGEPVTVRLFLSPPSTTSSASMPARWDCPASAPMTFATRQRPSRSMPGSRCIGYGTGLGTPACW
jgi:hypothetical protein